MPARVGRPKIIEEPRIVMTLRLDPKHHAALTDLAIESGIRSVNTYATFMLLQHVLGVARDRRKIPADEIPSYDGDVWPSELIS